MRPEVAGVHYGTTVETVSLHLTKSEQRLIVEANMQPWEIPRQEDLKNLAQGEYTHGRQSDAAIA
jgi:hypothetical protein